MRWIYKLPLRIRSLFRKNRVENELTEELRFHLEKLIQENIAKGMALEEARYAALRELGGVEQIKEECRDTRRLNYIETFLQDLRYGLRQLRRNSGFTAVAVLTLALGIGASTAMFSVVNAVLLRPLPFRAPAHLVAIWEANERDMSDIGGPASYPDFFDWQAQNRVFEQMAEFRTRNFTLTGAGQPARLSGAIVSADLFSVLGVRPRLGRAFLPQEDKPGGISGNNAVILSYDLWKARFGSDARMLGRTITLDDHSFTVVGVMPGGFHFPIQAEPIQVWATMAVDAVGTPGNSPLTAQRGSHSLEVVARLRPGVTAAPAQASLDALARALEKQYPLSNGFRGAVRVIPEFRQMVGNVRVPLLVLFIAVGFVLLIACVNVSNLLLARATARRKEIAVRSALGAGQVRVARQLLTESVLLSAIAGGLGGLLAFGGTKLFVSLSPGDIPRLNQAGMDSLVLGFTVVVSLVTGVLFGLVPVVGASKTNLTESLKDGGGRSLTGDTSGNHTRGALVVTEVALAIMLMVGAGLLIQSFVRLLDVNPGFDPNKTLTFNVTLPEARYAPAKQVAFYRLLLSHITTLPGVLADAAVSPLPLNGDDWGANFEVEGQPMTAKQRPQTNLRVITPDYFRTMRIPLLSGREFDLEDGAKSQPVVIINQTLARRFFANQNSVGNHIEVPLNGIMREVVGVVGDVKHESLRSGSGPEVYLPYTQWTPSSMTVVVRTENDPRGIINAARRTVGSLDGELPIFDVKTLDQYVTQSVGDPRFSSLLLSTFAGLALVLTAIGLYGVVGYAVAQRTHEIGIRMALGAQREDVLKMVIGQGLKLTLIGLGIGVVGALALARFLASLLYGVKPTDPLTFIAVSLILGTVALVACYIPARRATKVDPMVALRYE